MMQTTSECIFNVFYFGVPIGGANYRDEVKTYILTDVAVFDVVVSCLLQITDFLIADGNFRVSKQSVAARLDFDEDQFIMLTVQGNDVEVAVTAFPVTLHDDIPLAHQIGSSLILSPAS